MPATFDLEIYRGDTERWQFNVWTDSNKLIPANLSGCSANAQVCDRPGGTFIAMMTCSVAGSIIHMTLPSSESIKFPPTTREWIGAWDLQLTYPSGDITTVVCGAAVVTADVTASA